MDKPMASCQKCGNAVAIRTFAQGSGLCRSCGMRVQWERRHRIAAGTATPVDLAVQEHSRKRRESRQAIVGACATCGAEISGNSPVKPGRRCRTCFMKDRWGDDVRVGIKYVSTAFRIEANLMQRLRDASKQLDLRMISFVEGAIVDALDRYEQGSPPSRYEPR